MTTNITPSCFYLKVDRQVYKYHMYYDTFTFCYCFDVSAFIVVYLSKRFKALFS